MAITTTASTKTNFGNGICQNFKTVGFTVSAALTGLVATGNDDDSVPQGTGAPRVYEDDEGDVWIEMVDLSRLRLRDEKERVGPREMVKQRVAGLVKT